MLFNFLRVSFLVASALADCNTGAPAGIDLCSKIPLIGEGGWPVSWRIPLLKNISAEASDGSRIRLDEITITKVWIGKCSLTGTKENLTAAAETVGMELRATSSGAQVQAKVEIGNAMVQALRCLKPDPSHSGKMHGKFHAEGDTLASTIEVSALPKVLWSPASEDQALVPTVSASLDADNWLFHLVHPVIEAMLNSERSATATFDWCSALAPIMHKSVQCTDAKVCNMETLANKALNYMNMGSLPYKLPKLFDYWVASGDAYADNPRITKIISPTCLAKTSLPLAADVTSSGLQVVLQIDIRVHVCVLWVICHDLHPTTFATITLPGDLAATVTQAEGLGSLRVSQSLTEYAVDATWDEFLLGGTLGNSPADDLQNCAKTLSKDNATACDALAIEVAHESLALELGHGNLGVGLRSTIVDFVGLQMDGAVPPSSKVSISISNAEGSATEILI